MEATKLLLSNGFQAFYLQGDAKTGIPSLSLSRKMGANYRTAWYLRITISHVMSQWLESYVLRGRSSWMMLALARGCGVIADGLACFRAVAQAGCIHQPVIADGRHPKDLPDFRWMTTCSVT